MDRKIFLKSIVFGVMGTLLCPKEIFSTVINETNQPIIDETNKDDAKIPEDLIKFAKQFSERYKKLNCKHYISDCGKYTINYTHQIRDRNTGVLINTPSRISHTTGIMDFSKSKMVNMPPSVIFNSVIWCYLMKKSKDYIKSDLKSFKCSIENGYSKKELFVNYCNMFKNAPSDLNRNRIDELYKSLT